MEKKPPSSTTSPRVPVTLVTGALGAGKSTLLRHILNERHGYRIAVIENEFGPGAIESLILKDGVHGAAADGFIELANGCICCSLKDSLVTTLETLMQRRHAFDHILVETSGLADPGPVASIFWSDLGDDTRLCLDGVVAVVDAVHVGAQLAEGRAAAARGLLDVAAAQIAYADVVLLNKVDAVGGAAALQDVMDSVTAVSPTCRLIPTTRCVTDVGTLLGLRAYEMRDVLPRLPEEGGTGSRSLSTVQLEQCTQCPPPPLPHDCGAGSDAHHHHHHPQVEGGGGGGTHAHDPSVRSVLLSTRLPVDLDRFRVWVGTLLWEAVTTGAADAPIEGGGGDDDNDDDDDSGPPLLLEGGDDRPAPKALSALASEPRGTATPAPPPVVFRGKGVLYAHADGAGASGAAVVRRFIFQSVFTLFDVELASGDAAAPGADGPHGAAGESRVLLIGRGLDKEALQRALEACCVTAGV